MKFKGKYLHATFKLFCALIAICILLTTIACSSSKTSESCQHIWKSATCTAPKTCSLCDETTGVSLGHSWVDATCTSPKTCSACEEIEGSSLGHSWIDATCIAPKQCSVCETTDGTYSIYDHEGVESCEVCEIDYYQTLLNFVLTRGTKATNIYTGGIYWSYEKTVYISSDAYKFNLSKSEGTNFVACRLSKDSKYFFTINIEPGASGVYAYTFNYWHSTHVASDIEGKIVASTIDLDTTQLPYDNYSSTATALSPGETSQAATIYLQMLLNTMNKQFKSNSLPLSTKNFGFVNYPGN